MHKDILQHFQGASAPLPIPAGAHEHVGGPVMDGLEQRGRIEVTVSSSRGILNIALFKSLSQVWWNYTTLEQHFKRRHFIIVYFSLEIYNPRCLWNPSGEMEFTMSTCCHNWLYLTSTWIGE